MKTCIKPTKQDWKTLLTRKTIDSSILEESVSSILADVKSNKDKSLRFYSKMFDRVLLENLTVTNEEFEIGINQTDIKLKEAIDKAAENITKFHKSQSEAIKKTTTTEGVICWRENRGIEKGIAKGIVKGESRGENKMALLVKKLLDQNRIDDVKRASEDEKSRAELMKEFGIS